MRKFHQIVLLPLQLMPLPSDSPERSHRELFEHLAGQGCWTKVEDEFSGGPAQFKDRHYREFVTFLPHVQKFLYGAGARPDGKLSDAEAPLHVYRRFDVRKVRMTLEEGAPPAVFDVAQIDLYFFYDIDIVILAFELSAEDLDLAAAQDVLFRFGRAYPGGWSASGQATRCLRLVEWLAADGSVLAASDYENRGRYLSFVCKHRAPLIAAHWDFLLRPLTPDQSDDPGPLRYRQIEYYRMPLMAYLAMEDTGGLTRADYVRLALVTPPGDPQTLPFSARFLEDFETRYCYDRFYEGGERIGPEAVIPGEGGQYANWVGNRVLTCGLALIMTGGSKDRLFTDPERGLLAQFRHQYFLLFLIAHFHKATLLMVSDRLVAAMKGLDILNAESVRLFRRKLRQTMEIFLLFTHRYWFQEVSDQAQVRDLYRMLTRHLGSEQLYRGVREEVQDMNQYLDSEMLRRQSSTMVRLTVVTILGLIGTTVTGFLGMNLIAAAEQPLAIKIVYFLGTLLPIVALTLLTIMFSRRLSLMLDDLTDEQLPLRRKLRALRETFKASKET